MKGRRVPIAVPLSPVDRALANDRALFLADPTLHHFRRRYVAGECYAGDAPNGVPLVWTKVFCLTPLADARIRLFEVEDEENATGQLYMIADGESPGSMERANRVLQDTEAYRVGRLREVR
jgi:hypothetical protein